MRKLTVLFFMLLLASLFAVGGNKLKIIVLDEGKLPLHDAHIWHNGAIIGHTDWDGSYWINASDTDTLVVHYLGYKKYPIAMSNYENGNTLVVQLSLETVALREILVVSTNYQKLLKNAQEDFSIKYYQNQWACYGEYMRVTKQNNAYVDFYQRIGYTVFIGGKNAKDYILGGCSFLPEQSRSSYFFENQGGYRQLDQLFDSKFTYVANTKSLTEHYRNLERYGPQNLSMASCYTYSLSAIDDTLLVVNFHTNRKYIPKRIRMDGRGKMFIDTKNTRIVKIEFEQIHVRQNDKVAKLTKYPLRYITTFSVSYVHDSLRVFPVDMQFSRHWLSDDRGNILSDGFSPRFKPGKTNVVEYEYFVSQKCQVNEKSVTAEMSKIYFQLALMSINEKLNYDSVFWSGRSIPNLVDQKRLYADLSQVLPISEQFTLLNGQFKSGPSFIDNFLRPEYHEAYHKAWEDANILLEKFGSYEYQNVP